ncbi:MAG: ATP synthase subunit I [Actinomycetes bacterium]
MSLAPADVRVGLPEDHESRVADHMVRRALLVAPAVIVAAALLGGRRSVVGALLGVTVVALNFLLASRLITWSARISPEAVSVAAIGGYVLRFGLITLAAIALSGRPGVSITAFVLTVAGMHLGLLFWEMPSVSLTLGAPGLKPVAPGPISHSPRKEEG